MHKDYYLLRVIMAASFVNTKRDFNRSFPPGDGPHQMPDCFFVWRPHINQSGSPLHRHLYPTPAIPLKSSFRGRYEAKKKLFLFVSSTDL